jgi:methyl-accepting chemotaxis protein
MARQKRRLFPIVNKSIQYRFLAMTLVHVFSLLLLIALFVFVPDILEMGKETSSLETRLAAANRVLFFHARFWPVLLALVVVITLHSFHEIHRIVGPLYRFRVSFDRIRGGDLGFTVRLRKKDYLDQEKESLNGMIQAMREKLQQMQDLTARSLASQKAFAQHLEGGSPDHATGLDLCSRLGRDLDELNAIMGRFRLNQD